MGPKIEYIGFTEYGLTYNSGLWARTVLSNVVTTDTCVYWALEMCLVLPEMFCKCKIHTRFWRLSTKEKKRM